MSLDEALSHVQSCRPIVQPNLSFMSQLSTYHEKLTVEREKTLELEGTDSDRYTATVGPAMPPIEASSFQSVGPTMPEEEKESTSSAELEFSPVNAESDADTSGNKRKCEDTVSIDSNELIEKKVRQDDL